MDKDIDGALVDGPQFLVWHAVSLNLRPEVALDQTLGQCTPQLEIEPVGPEGVLVMSSFGQQVQRNQLAQGLARRALGASTLGLNFAGIDGDQADASDHRAQVGSRSRNPRGLGRLTPPRTPNAAEDENQRWQKLHDVILSDRR